MQKGRCDMAVIYVIQNSGGSLWGASADIYKAQEKIAELEKIYDDQFYIVTVQRIDVEV